MEQYFSIPPKKTYFPLWDDLGLSYREMQRCVPSVPCVPLSIPHAPPSTSGERRGRGRSKSQGGRGAARHKAGREPSALGCGVLQGGGESCRGKGLRGRGRGGGECRGRGRGAVPSRWESIGAEARVTAWRGGGFGGGRGRGRGRLGTGGAWMMRARPRGGGTSPAGVGALAVGPRSGAMEGARWGAERGEEERARTGTVGALPVGGRGGARSQDGACGLPAPSPFPLAVGRSRAAKQPRPRRGLPSWTARVGAGGVQDAPPQERPEERAGRAGEVGGHDGRLQSRERTRRAAGAAGGLAGGRRASYPPPPRQGGEGGWKGIGTTSPHRGRSFPRPTARPRPFRGGKSFFGLANCLTERRAGA